ncbi:hypothetical protein L484_000133 [Morus notabilis]|uniref:Uncharacterized protein n=1 Tax=Morus notabilis TaxID=981085 RepID=W9SFP9_9ROSA|nr:hypothetical protein L484_000133 [Morus notabilis]
MEASLLPPSILTTPSPASNTHLRITNFTVDPTKSSTLNLTSKGKHSRLIGSKSLQVRKVAGVEEFSAAADAAPIGVTWQIVVGAAGMYME